MHTLFYEQTICRSCTKIEKGILDDDDGDDDDDDDDGGQ